jgi:hypothetical protein
MLAWPLMLLVALMVGYRRWQYIVFWVAATVLSLIFYFWGYQSGGLLDIGYVLSHLGELAEYVLAYLGAPFTVVSPPAPFPIMLSVAFGLIGILLLLFNVGYLWWHSRDLTRLAAWIAIAGFSVGSATLTGVGRLTLGIPGALAERYVIHSSLLWCSVIGLSFVTLADVLQASPKPKWGLLLGNTNTLACVGLFFLYSCANYTWAMTSPIVPLQEQPCVTNYVFFRQMDQACASLLPRHIPTVEFIP